MSDSLASRLNAMSELHGAARPPSRDRPAPRLECKICWGVYDPALGDDVWQIPPGTPFAELPAHWTLPEVRGREAPASWCSDD